MNKKVISVDFHAQFGFLKKPEINEDQMFLTFNCLHKPALLGILGAIAGLGGYAQGYHFGKDRLPEYWKKLNHLKVGIQPPVKTKGNFQKFLIRYNNSVGYASDELGGNLIVKEQTLFHPFFTVYLELDTDSDIESLILHRLEERESFYIPYCGKNEFQIYWEKFKEYAGEAFQYDFDYSVSSIMIKEGIIKDMVMKSKGGRINLSSPRTQDGFFMYFERLPIGFSSETGQYQYQLEEFVFTNCNFPREVHIKNVYRLKGDTGDIYYVQLF